jgi:hypothetical protein
MMNVKKYIFMQFQTKPWVKKLYFHFSINSVNPLKYHTRLSNLVHKIILNRRHENLTKYIFPLKLIMEETVGRRRKILLCLETIGHNGK